MADPSVATTEVKASCLCGQLSVSAKVPDDELPIDMWLCHCNTCRHVSGHLAITCLNIHRPVTITGESTAYMIPNGPGLFSRNFCPTCGSSVFEDGKKSSRNTSIAAGALEKVEGIVNIRGHIAVGDTGDGGLSIWLPQLPAFEKGGEDGPRYSGPTKALPTAAYSSDDKLNCTCRCGGVQFYITRPNEESSKLNSPYADSIVSHVAGGDNYKNHEDAKWWLCADDTKYAASLCACISCRKSSGYDIQQWAFVPKVNIFQKDGTPLDFSMGTLQEYSSSKDVMRHFCGKCGATVFWRTTERPKLIDVSVGLMDAPSGSRAEEWLDWKLERVSFTEFAQNKGLIEMLEGGLKGYQRIRPSLLRCSES